jgi:putative zinc finger/helix-turn-helix YgiT family protein
MKTTECSNCGAVARVVRSNYHMKELGLNVILKGAEIVRCKECGNEDPILHRMDDLIRAVALAVVRKPYRLTGEEVRFVRKYLHLTGQEFAKLLKVDNSTLSKWEHGEDPVGPQSDLLIRFFGATMGEGLRDCIGSVVAQMDAIRAGRPRQAAIEISAETMDFRYA